MIIEQFHTGNWAVTTEPATEPVTLTEMKTWLKVDASADDDLITSLIASARELAERYCQIGLITQTITETFKWLHPEGLRLSVSPLISVTSITYKDTGGNSQTLTTDYYGTDAKQRPPVIYPKPYTVFPDTYDVPDAVTVVYTVGYGAAASDVPEAIKTAIKLMVADWYDNRTDAVRNMPTASRLILDNPKFRVNWF